MFRLKMAATCFVAAATLLACGGRDQNTPTTDAGGNPCVGDCADGGGVDAGNNNMNGDGGMKTDAGLMKVTLSIAQLRSGGAQYGQQVKVENVVVTAVSQKTRGSAGDWRGDFWVSEADDPTSGIWVEKFYFDTPTTYEPKVGDVLTIDGWYGNNSSFEDRVGYRQVIKGEFDFVQANARVMAITVVEESGTALAPVDTSSGFGNAQNGDVAANPEFGGARVHIPGPLKVTDPNPRALDSIRLGERLGSAGFEVTGGILVNNYKTFHTTNRPSACDWRRVATDAGRFNQEVVFDEGLTGVWDSYTHAPCVDGGTRPDGGFQCNSNQRGSIPGSSFDGGPQETRWTFVLYPQDCTDIPGRVQNIP